MVAEGLRDAVYPIVHHCSALRCELKLSTPKSRDFKHPFVWRDSAFNLSHTLNLANWNCSQRAQNMRRAVVANH